MQKLKAIGPATATRMEHLEFFVVEDQEAPFDETTFTLGDPVTLDWPDGTHLIGTIEKFFGVGRIAGVSIKCNHITGGPQFRFVGEGGASPTTNPVLRHI